MNWPETRDWLGKVCVRALCHVETLHATYWLTRMALETQIQGDFVECGVFAGAQGAAMARACMDLGQQRKIHLFDSFQGIPKAGPEDNEISGLLGRGGPCEPSGISSQSVDQVKEHLTEWGVPLDYFVFHEGWFDDTLPNVSIEQIAILRLDADLYHGTKLALEHLYGSLAVGGWCVIDDYQMDGCRQSVDEFIRPAPVYWQKGQK